MHRNTFIVGISEWVAYVFVCVNYESVFLNKMLTNPEKPKPTWVVGDWNKLLGIRQHQQQRRKQHQDFPGMAQQLYIH